MTGFNLGAEKSLESPVVSKGVLAGAGSCFPLDTKQQQLLVLRELYPKISFWVNLTSASLAQVSVQTNP